ncbi:PD40 domain-containing protein [Fuerstiella marisgermanici]|nr:PD40 domain-containing protein [Fuerstiella marisgermanici]
MSFTGQTQISSRHSVRILLLIACASASSAAFAAPPTVEQVNQALDIAEKAARHGMTDLSQSAVRRSLQFGPPTVSNTRDDGAKLRMSNARVDTSREFPPTALESNQLRIPRLVMRLLEGWKAEANSVQIYETLRSIVLPEHRNQEAFLYSLPVEFDTLQPHRFPVVDSIGHRLINCARHANKLGALRQQLGSPRDGDTIERAILTLLVADALGDDDLLRRQTDLLVNSLRAGTDRASVELVALQAVTIGRQSRHRDAVADLLQRAATVIAAMNRNEPVANSSARAIVLAAARAQFEAGRRENGVKLLGEYRKLKVKGRFGVWPSGIEIGQTQIVGHELFARGLDAEAREILGRESAEEFERRYQTTSLPQNAGASEPEPVSPASAVKIQPAADIKDRASVAGQIWVCQWDSETEESKLLFTLPTFQAATAAAVAPDGNSIAIVAALPGQAVTSDTEIYVATMDGRSIRSLGKGTLPSWSPGGGRLAYSRFSPARGVWIMRADGTNRQLIDESGWGAAWSPDGRMIAYADTSTATGDIRVFDLAEDTFRSPLNAALSKLGLSHPQQFAWSSDSTQLAFTASRKQGGADEAATLLSLKAYGKARLTTLLSEIRQPASGVAWQRHSEAIVFASATPQTKYEQLHMLVAEGETAATVPGQFPGRRNLGASWMPDGKTLIYISRPVKP